MVLLMKELVRTDEHGLVRRLSTGNFSLMSSSPNKKRSAPNETVDRFARENFGSYENYLEEIRRFILEDSVKILSAIGNGPLLYHQVKGERGICLIKYAKKMCIDSLYQDLLQEALGCDEDAARMTFNHILMTYREEHGLRESNRSSYIDTAISGYLAKKGLALGDQRKTQLKNIENMHLLQYVPAADFYLSPDEFSMDIVTIRTPTLAVREDGIINELGFSNDPKLPSDCRTESDIIRAVLGRRIDHSNNEYNMWGVLSEDPKLYQSLVSVVNGVKEGANFSKVKFEWNDGFCEFFKPNHKFGACAQKYMKQHNPKLLEAYK